MVIQIGKAITKVVVARLSVLPSGTPLRFPIRFQEISWKGSFQSIGRECHGGSGGDFSASAISIPPTGEFPYLHATIQLISLRA